jgi:Cof subfamily protein (haloacid dehalogenase superfamily)
MTDRIFAGKLLVCDIDGTLMNSRNQISPANIRAIKRFVDLGGKFTVASGRTLAAIAAIQSAVPINMPVITVNGAIINRLYEQDYSAVWESRLDDQVAQGLIEQLVDMFPGLGIEIFTDRAVYPVKINTQVRNHAIKEVILGEEYLPDDIPRPWCKICLAWHNEGLQAVNQFLQSAITDDFHVVFSEETFLDILHHKTTKGEAVKILIKMSGLSRENSYAIGDNYNDLDLFREVGCTFAVANACDALKHIATYQVAANDADGVAEAIAIIEQTLKSSQLA